MNIPGWRKQLTAIGCLFFFAISICAQTETYKRNDRGVIIYPKDQFSGNTKMVQLQVINEKIIRVTASPVDSIYSFNSVAVLPQAVYTNWQLKENNGMLALSTVALTATIDPLTGSVSFSDNAGKLILSEKKAAGRLLQPVMHEGRASWRIRQSFETDETDAYYGLGQHQDDVWNYRGKQVQFFQNNTEVAVPFLVSVKNYGLLWDNYSYGLAGDTRPYQPLSGLQLYDKNGNAGWLTASYNNDKSKPGQISFEKAESEIDYAWLGDTRRKLPREFAIEKGNITWKGNIAAQQSGLYQFRFTYGGYLKCRLNGKLVFDKWRMAWNPGTALVDLEMEAGKKYPIEIEWIPDGTESYISAAFLPPTSESNIFSFDSEAGKQLDYYFVYGKNIDEVIHGYRQLTGKATLLPRWAFGFWQSRERYKSQQELLETVAEFRKRKIPIDNIVQDWFYWKENEWGSQEFDKARFPNPDSMIKVLHNQYKMQFMISVWPKFYEGISTYKDFDNKGWLYTRNIANRQKDWVGPGYVSTFYDVFNENARKGFWKLLHDKLYVKGIDAWWMDASEPDILSNSSPFDRKLQMQPLATGTAAEYMNAYPLLNAQGIYEGQRGSDSSKRVLLLTRSGFAGSQRYGAVIWSGDIGSRWEDMRTQITAGMNFCISGLPWWTMDIGGFAVEKRYERPNETDLAEWRELQMRWYQWGSFLPMFRAHGQFPVREIFNIAPSDHPAYQSMLYYNKLRYRLLPYIYSLAGRVYQEDYTMMRGLVMDFAHDKKVWNVGDQFMLGPSLMICPVYTYKATARKVYLPAGQGWYDLYTGKYFEGGQEITADAPYEKVPVFVKEGSILLTGPELQYAGEKKADPVTVHVYGGKDAEFGLYEDEGMNYNYEKGRFASIKINYDEVKKTLTLSQRQGNFAGMLNERSFYISVLSKEKLAGIDFVAKPRKPVRYKGREVKIRLIRTF
jgi:alpha-D-xyloside xylohydrolase